MQRLRSFEFLLILAVVSGLTLSLRAKDRVPAPEPATSSPASSENDTAAVGSPQRSSDPDLLLHLPLDGDARSVGYLPLDTEAAELSFRHDLKGDSNGFAEFTESSFISILDAKNVNGLKEFTLSAWVNPRELREHLNVISKVTPARDFNLQIDRLGQVVTHVAIDRYEFCYTKKRIEPGRWTHLAATFKNFTWTIYIDGQVAAEQKVDMLPQWSGQYLTVGNLYPGAGEAFLGGIDEVRVYKRALAGSEIEELMSR